MQHVSGRCHICPQKQRILGQGPIDVYLWPVFLQLLIVFLGFHLSARNPVDQFQFTWFIDIDIDIASHVTGLSCFVRADNLLSLRACV